MNTDPTRMAVDLQYLLDRTAILDCIASHSRGGDRHDPDLLSAAYHPDAVDEHGHATTSGLDYAEWANTSHADTSRAHTHNITTHHCEIDGDIAHAESYVLVVLLGNDSRTAQFISGRYLDRLERRDGHWRIALRRCTVEIMFTADARVMNSAFFAAKGYPHGTRDHHDLAYSRPLTLEAPASRWQQEPET